MTGLFRKSDTLAQWTDVYADMLANIIAGKMNLKEAAIYAGEKIGFDVEASVEEANSKVG